jgi:CRISPR-associated endonuclease/helicase Cas3
MFSRVFDWMETIDSWGDAHSILLAHGKANFNADYCKIKPSQQINVGREEEERDGDGGLIVHERLSGRKKGMLADFVIGTIDQLLFVTGGNAPNRPKRKETRWPKRWP